MDKFNSEERYVVSIAVRLTEQVWLNPGHRIRKTLGASPGNEMRCVAATANRAHDTDGVIDDGLRVTPNFDARRRSNPITIIRQKKRRSIRQDCPGLYLWFTRQDSDYINELGYLDQKNSPGVTEQSGLRLPSSVRLFRGYRRTVETDAGLVNSRSAFELASQFSNEATAKLQSSGMSKLLGDYGRSESHESIEVPEHLPGSARGTTPSFWSSIQRLRSTECRFGSTFHTGGLTCSGNATGYGAVVPTAITIPELKQSQRRQRSEKCWPAIVRLLKTAPQEHIRNKDFCPL